MIVYDSAKTSLDIEQYILQELSMYPSIEELKRSPFYRKDHNENIYQIEINVKQVEPPL